MKILKTILIAAFVGIFVSGVLSFASDIFRNKPFYLGIKDVLGVTLLSFTALLAGTFFILIITWIINYKRNNQ